MRKSGCRHEANHSVAGNGDEHIEHDDNESVDDEAKLGDKMMPETTRAKVAQHPVERPGLAVLRELDGLINARLGMEKSMLKTEANAAITMSSTTTKERMSSMICMVWTHRAQT